MTSLNGTLQNLDLVVSRMDSPPPSTLRELNHAIQRFNTKIISITLNDERDRNDEIQRLQLIQIERLNQMISAKNVELDRLQKKYTMNTSVNRERQREIKLFVDYCQSEVEHLRESMAPFNDEKVDINEMQRDQIEQQHVDQKQSVKRRNGRLTRSATSKRLHFVRSTDALESSLNDDEIEMDLQYLWDKAKEMDIDVPEDFMSMNANDRKKHKNPSIPSVVTSEEDMKRIRSICSVLDLDLPDKALKVRLYGYGQSHLDVYRDIFEWVTSVDEKQHRKIVNELSSGKLRDLQVKLRSPGQVGRKAEMAKGIQQTLRTLTARYKGNSHSD